ncbi:hypothetical protein LUZ60_000490 [Juncus effusus]|nr:hypothetical protein LUZ60_000490 [Juncus effusus]
MTSVIKCAFLTLVSILVLFSCQIPCKVDATKSLTSGPTNSSSVAVYIGGMVFCKSCKFWGYVNSMDASPLSGAVVRITCYYTSRKPVTVVATTGATGYFLTKWPDMVNFSTRKCRAYLTYSPFTFCKIPVYPKYPASAPIVLETVQNTTRGGVQAFYSPGVLMYGPSSSNKICSYKG